MCLAYLKWNIFQYHMGNIHSKEAELRKQFKTDCEYCSAFKRELLFSFVTPVLLMNVQAETFTDLNAHGR